MQLFAWKYNTFLRSFVTLYQSKYHQENRGMYVAINFIRVLPVPPSSSPSSPQSTENDNSQMAENPKQKASNETWIRNPICKVEIFKPILKMIRPNFVCIADTCHVGTFEWEISFSLNTLNEQIAMRTLIWSEKCTNH